MGTKQNIYDPIGTVAGGAQNHCKIEFDNEEYTKQSKMVTFDKINNEVYLYFSGSNDKVFEHDNLPTRNKNVSGAIKRCFFLTIYIRMFSKQI